MRFSNLRQWLFWLETINVDRSAAISFQEGKIVAEQLGLLKSYPHRVITITGTNGKGTCVALLESIYLAAGYRVASFTSPHLFQFNERIGIGRKPVSDQLICQAFSQIDQARKNITLTYFQFATLAALLIFKQMPLDLVILEVGIGGRYDPTNLLDADLSIITNIAIDHYQLLGETREKIAFEKAGIMRPNQICICGDREPPMTLLERARDLSVKLYRLGRDFNYQENSETLYFCSHDTRFENLPKNNLIASNIATVLMAIEKFQSYLSVTEEAIIRGIKDVKIIARCQVIHRNQITFVLDVAHNPAAIDFLKDQITSLKIPGRTFAICGMCQDKDVKNNFKGLVQSIDEWFVVTLNHPRGANAQQLATVLKTLGVTKIYPYHSIKIAWQMIQKQLKPGDGVIIFGSFMLMGEILQYFFKILTKESV